MEGSRIGAGCCVVTIVPRIGGCASRIVGKTDYSLVDVFGKIGNGQRGNGYNAVACKRIRKCAVADNQSSTIRSTIGVGDNGHGSGGSAWHASGE